MGKDFNSLSEKGGRQYKLTQTNRQKGMGKDFNSLSEKGGHQYKLTSNKPTKRHGQGFKQPFPKQVPTNIN